MIKNIQQFVSIFSGLKYNSKNINAHQAYVFLIQVKDIQNNFLYKDNLFKIFETKIDPDQFLRKGDILFSAKGNRNFAYHYNGGLGEAVASSTFFIIRITTADVLPEYLTWYLNSKPAQDFFKANIHGTFIPSIPKSKLVELKIPIPDLKTQKIISQLDAHQRLEQKILKQISTKRTLLINELIHHKILRKK
ncbi:MAG: restriction endonuclease subunit S [Ignavibacteria bacterium]|nr:restriction endonuclease subunit S [Ignavibacteria bacterium]